MHGSDIRDEVIAIASGMVGDGWVRVVCPACLANDGKKRDNLAINLNTGYFQCWRCGVRGGISDQRAVGHYANAHRALEQLQRERALPSVPLPDGFVTLTDPTFSGHPKVAKASRFLLRRGVSLDVAHEIGIGIVLGRYKYADRVIVPVVVDGGRVCGFTSRLYISPEEIRAVATTTSRLSRRSEMAASLGESRLEAIPKYLYPRNMSRLAMFNRDALQVVTSEPALLVEGAMDALPHWPNAVAFLGKPTRKQVAWVCDNARRPVIVVLDGDAWREGLATAKDMLLLGGLHVGYLRLPPGSDPGDILTGRISAMIGNTVWLS